MTPERQPNVNFSCILTPRQRGYLEELSYHEELSMSEVVRRLITFAYKTASQDWQMWSEDDD